MKKKKFDWNALHADLQDMYAHMNPAQLSKEFDKGASKIWDEIFDYDTNKIMMKKILAYKRKNRRKKRN